MPNFLTLNIGSCAALQGTHKILKKHDKMVPHAPCRQFWISHLHSQSWVQASPQTLNPEPRLALPWTCFSAAVGLTAVPALRMLLLRLLQNEQGMP